MHSFQATLEIIGINPYVHVPADVLEALFEAAGKDRGPIPILGTVNNRPYRQTLVKYSGAWRLYINMTMLPKSPERIGESIHLTIAFDPADRSPAMHPTLQKALDGYPEAKTVFDAMSPSRKQEIVRYIANLKSETSVSKNVHRALDFLMGNGRFAGRDKP